MGEWMNLPSFNCPSGLRSKLRCRPTNQKTANEILLNPTGTNWTYNGVQAGAHQYITPFMEFCGIVGGELFVVIRLDETSQDEHGAYTIFELESRDEPV